MEGSEMSEKDVAAFWRIFLQTEEIIYHGNNLLTKPIVKRLGLSSAAARHQEFWKGYLKALMDVGVEVLGISKSRFESGLDFDFKLRVARRLQQKYPDGEIGFVFGAVLYTVVEIDALEGFRNLF